MKLKLTTKTVLYSVALALLIIALLLGWMLGLLPGLYMRHMRDSAMDEMLREHVHWVDNGRFEARQETMSFSTMGLRIPREGYTLRFDNYVISSEIELQSPKLKTLLDELRDWLPPSFDQDDPAFQRFLDRVDGEQAELDVEALLKRIEGIIGMTGENGLVRATLLHERQLPEEELETTSITRPISDDGMLFYASVDIGGVRYTSLLGFTQRNDTIYISYMPVMTPYIEQIRGVTLGSLPMLIAVIALVILLASLLFSRHIVQPIVQLAQGALSLRQQSNVAQDRDGERRRPQDTRAFLVRGDDEIAELGQSLQALYAQLEAANLALRDENERQDVLLRASSHQLKTPIAAALLLSEGMIAQVGKYRDYERYLPELRAQVQSMQQIVDKLLHLHRRDHVATPERVDVAVLMREQLGALRHVREARGLSAELRGELELTTDVDTLSTVLADLLSNAMRYSAEGGWVSIVLTADTEAGLGRIEIRNGPAQIPDEIREVMFEAFVRGSESGSAAGTGHGLGLYLARWHARRIDARLSVANEGEGVCARLELPLNGA